MITSSAQPATPVTDRRLPNRARAVGLGVTVAVIAIDQLTKSIVLATIGRTEEVRLFGGVRLIRRFNTGMAFSQGSGSSAVGWIVTLVVVALTVWVFRTLWKRPGTPGAPTIGFAAALGGLLGGALGNKVDRLFRSGGAVVDFIDVGFWPVFNIADSALCVACVALVLLSVRDDRAARNQTQTS